MNILLVDDEYLIRAKLFKYLKAGPFAFNNIFEASNGLEAMEIIRNNSIDIAIIDIQMPKLTGIELLQNLRSESYQTNVIFLTGFEKFEYARQAIKYNIVEYLLKPVKKSDLYNAIEKCISLIEKSDQNLVALNELDEKSKYQYIVDSLYNDLDINNSPFNIKNDNFIFVSVELSKKSYINDLYSFLNYNFKSYDIIYGLSKRNKIIIINSIYSDSMRELFNSLVEKKILYYCYFNKNCKDIKKIKDSFFECITLFPSKIFYNEFSIFTFKDIKYKTYSLSKNLKLDFELLARSDSKNSLINKFEFYLNEINAIKDVHALKLLINYFLSSIEEVFLEGNGEYLSLINLDHLTNNLLYTSKDIASIKMYCCTYYERLTKEQSKVKNTKNSISSKTILKVKNYIDQNYYSDDINLDFLSSHFYINSCHLSSTFKKITGESLVEYITKRRINEAKSLLKNDDIKLAEVAEKVGYKDYYYFSKLFKKHVGISPLKYKQTSNI